MSGLLAKLRAAAAWAWRGQEQKILPPGTRLLDLPGFRPEGFACGIELLNDAATPLPFVIAQLERHARLAQKEAAQLAVRIHVDGGALVATTDDDTARAMAAAIDAEARAAGFPLVCRAVRAQ